MSDLISRQAAMDICDAFNGQGSVWAVIKGYIKALPPVEPKQESMTVEEYRKRMMDAFHNADCDELIALVVLPSEKEFEHLEWLLEKHYKAKPEQKQEWIPVSEKLPSDCGYDWVLAQIQESDTGYLWLPCVAEYRKGIDDWFSDANDISWLRKHEGAFKVIAWMPLPEPYKMCGGDTNA